ncbi:hypothetical protein BJV77DRAFT_1015428, partial [Russula vinacea]
RNVLLFLFPLTVWLTAKVTLFEVVIESRVFESVSLTHLWSAAPTLYRIYCSNSTVLL